MIFCFENEPFSVPAHTWLFEVAITPQPAINNNDIMMVK